MPPLCTVGSFLWHLLFGFKDLKRVYWGPTFRDSSPSGSLPTVQSPSPIGALGCCQESWDSTHDVMTPALHSLSPPLLFSDSPRDTSSGPFPGYTTPPTYN